MSHSFLHPELCPGETFLINSNNIVFGKMPWRTKRKGQIAYDGRGNRLEFENFFPVFLTEQEIKASGLSLKEIRQAWADCYNHHHLSCYPSQHLP